MKDNVNRLLNVVEDPGCLSVDELDVLLRDQEVRTIYGILSKTADALADTPEPDVDKEWAMFAMRHRTHGTKRSFSAFFTRQVAAIIVAVASIAVFAATIGVRYSFSRNKAASVDETEIVEREPDVASEPDIAAETDMETSVPETVVFKDQSFERIISVIGEYYGATVSFQSDISRDLHLYFKWDQSRSLSEIVEQLNSFEQIDITVSDGILIIK